jgi:hypothetical protein
LELVSTNVEVRTQSMWRFSTKTIVITCCLQVLIATPLLSRRQAAQKRSIEYPEQLKQVENNNKWERG